MTAKDLKNAILQLAVRGILVAQNPDDEPASELLKCIRLSRGQLQKNKVAKKSQATEDIDESEIPFDLPDNWTWAKLGWISQKIGAGSTPLGGAAVYVANGIKFLREQNVHDDGLHLSGVVFIDENTHHQMSGSIVHPQDILMNITGASIGRNALVEDDFDEANVNQHVLIIRLVDKALRHYLHYCLCAPCVLNQMFSKQIGDKPGLSARKVENFLVPLPPLAEQKRIVAKIEELMPLVEEYGKKEERLSSLDVEFPDALRKSILQQAIQGKLTKRDPADEPASELLRRIRSTRNQLQKNKAAKKCQATEDIDESETPFDLPEKWTWAKLGWITQKVGAGSTPQGGAAVYVPNGIKFLREQNVHDDGLHLSAVVFIDEKTHQQMAGSIVHPQDILMNITGASIGRNALVADNFDEANVNQHVLIIRLVDKALRLYLHYCLCAPFVLNQMFSKQIGDKPGLSAKKVENFLVPLPPLAEQQRIVARVDELLAMCDELKAVSNRMES